MDFLNFLKKALIPGVAGQAIKARQAMTGVARPPARPQAQSGLVPGAISDLITQATAYGGYKAPQPMAPYRYPTYAPGVGEDEVPIPQGHDFQRLPNGRSQVVPPFQMPAFQRPPGAMNVMPGRDRPMMLEDVLNSNPNNDEYNLPPYQAPFYRGLPQRPVRRPTEKGVSRRINRATGFPSKAIQDRFNQLDLMYRLMGF